MKNLIFLFAVTLALAGCRRIDNREITIEIPGLAAVAENAAEHDAAQRKIAAALGAYAGVDRDSLVWGEAGKPSLTLRFDSLQIAEMNIRKAIEETGYAVVYPELTEGAPAGYINTRKPEVK